MDDFEKVYKSLQTDEYIRLEKACAKIKRANTLSIIFVLIFIVSLFSRFFISITNFQIPATYFLFTASLSSILAFISIIITGTKYSKDNKYIQTFINVILLPLFNSVFCDTSYDLNNFFPKDDYAKCSFDESYDLYLNERLITTKFANMPNSPVIVLSDVETRKESSDTKGRSSYTMLFSGIAGKLDYTPNITDDFRIKRNNFHFLGINSTDRTEIDSSEFEKYFDVECKNNILAMQILTSDIISDLTSCIKDYDIPFEINICKDDGVYFRFFYINIFRNGFNFSNYDMSKESIKKLYTNLVYIKNILTDIYTSLENLNG